MGAAESREQEAEIVSVFTPDERHRVRSLYEKIVVNQKTLTAPFLQKFYPKWLGEDIQHILFFVICNCEVNKNRSHENRHISEIQFAGFLAQLLKGRHSEKTDILYLLCRGMEGVVVLGKLNQIIKSIVRSYVILSKGDSTNETWSTTIREEHIDRFSRSLLGIKEDQSAESERGKTGKDEMETWITKYPLFLHMYDRVFNELFPVNNKESFTKSFMPNVTNVDWSKTNTILDVLSINYINFHLPRIQQTEWRLLYSNDLHGESFAQLVRFICDKGPSVMVVRDKDGHCFGAYAAESWDMKPHFYGTSDCFLFTLSPRYGVYTTTGYNENFMYLNLGQETLPNGLGLGGQLDYFGLWIDFTFNVGHSKAIPKCTTYGSPQLSARPEFEVDIIEVWAVGPEKKHEGDSDEEEKTLESIVGKGEIARNEQFFFFPQGFLSYLKYNKRSILDKDASAKAILELAGKKQHSEGIRELTEEEGPLSDEMKKKMNTIPKLL